MISAGTPSKLAVVLALALCCTTGASAALNMSHVCALVSDGTKIASDSACSSYYQCAGGAAVLTTCPGSLYFNKDTQSCVDPSEVYCLADTQEPCYGRTVGSFVPVAGACAGYYYCSATGPLRGNCPTGESFSASTQSCIYNSYCSSATDAGSSGDGTSTMTTPAVDLCTYIANGVYFGSPTNCHAWNLCTNNIMTSGICANNMVFNPQIGLCDYQSDWSCSQVTHDPSLSNTAATNGGTCSNPTQTMAAGSCNTYYQCNGANYQLVECSTGLYYDTVSGTCVNRMDAHNDCDRCVGTSKTFVNMYSTSNCAGYLYCQNGVQVSSGYCSTGYFDEAYGACVVEDDPPYPCCNPNTDSATMTTEASGASSEASGASSEASGDSSETSTTEESITTTQSDGSMG